MDHLNVSRLLRWVAERLGDALTGFGLLLGRVAFPAITSSHTSAETFLTLLVDLRCTVRTILCLYAKRDPQKLTTLPIRFCFSNGFKLLVVGMIRLFRWISVERIQTFILILKTQTLQLVI